MSQIDNTFHARLHYDNDQRTLATPGIDWGRKLMVIAQHKNQIVVRRKGHMSWSGVGFTEYAPTLYMRLRLDKRREEATVLDSCEPGRAWRVPVKKLIADCASGKPASARP